MGEYGEFRGYVTVIGEKKTILFLYVYAKKDNYVWHLNEIEWEGSRIKFIPS